MTQDYAKSFVHGHLFIIVNSLTLTLTLSLTLSLTQTFFYFLICLQLKGFLVVRGMVLAFTAVCVLHRCSSDCLSFVWLSRVMTIFS